MISTSTGRPALEDLLNAGFDPGQEEAYQADLSLEKWRVFWQTNLLCIVLYASFALLDRWAIGALYATWAIRGTVVAITAAVTWAAGVRRRQFLRYYVPVIAFLYVIWSAGIICMIALARQQDLAWGGYYAGLILVSIALYAWTYLSWRHGLVIGLIIVVSYVACAVLIQHMTSPATLPILLANCFFLIGANIIGLFCMHTRENFARDAFVLKQAMRRELALEEAAKQAHAYEAEHDGLTGLTNRIGFQRALAHLLESAGAAQEVAVLFLDLNGFKPINDRYGHAAGDEVLRCVAQRIRQSIRNGDLAGRVGGDEFVIAFAYPAGSEAWLARLSRQLALAIAEPIEWEGETMYVTTSIGAADTGQCARDVEALLAKADAQMYVMKHARPLVARA